VDTEERPERKRLLKINRRKDGNWLTDIILKRTEIFSNRKKE